MNVFLDRMDTDKCKLKTIVILPSLYSLSYQLQVYIIIIRNIIIQHLQLATNLNLSLIDCLIMIRMLFLYNVSQLTINNNIIIIKLDTVHVIQL